MIFVVVSNEWMSAHGIMLLPTMRKSKDGTKIILHEDYFRSFDLSKEETEALPTYAHNSEELDRLLSSDEWNGGEEIQTVTPDFIQVAAVKNLMTATKASIQSMNLTTEEALAVKDVFPDWEVGIDVKAGEKYNCDDDLWEVLTDHKTQENWRPSMQTLSIWEKVQVEHTGEEDDPIPFEQGMNLEKNKYYSQYGVVYKAIQDANAVIYDLKDVPALAQPVNQQEEKEINL